MDQVLSLPHILSEGVSLQYQPSSAYDSEDKIFVDDASDFVAGDQFDVVRPNLVNVIALTLDAAVSISITTDPNEAGQLSTLTQRLE